MAITRLLSAALLACACTTTPAGIFRYQDADGHWQFSDRPPSGHRAELIDEPYARVKGPRHDLAARLEETFRPRTALERATLAVVAIELGLGSGSGFFVSPDGYLVTNRHVLRPQELGPWKELTEALAAKEVELESLSAEHEEMQRRLASMRDEVRRSEAMLEGFSDSENSDAQARHARLVSSYEYRRRGMAEMRERLEKRRRALRLRKLELSWEATAASLQTSFKIVLKDKTTLTAFLISTSDDHDLALLKLDGHHTPALPIAADGWLGQGEQVFAVGNPAGMADALTSGVITTLQDGKIVTDAQILPGNSGGPLLNARGEVIGVNVAKLTGGDSVYDQGFGTAIPIMAAVREFPELQRAFSDDTRGRHD